MAVCAALVVAPPISSGMLQAEAFHFLGDMHHLIERRRDQSAEADDVRLFSRGGFEDLLARHHDAEVDDLEAVAGQHHADDVLADVMHVALDGGDDDAARGVALAASSATA